jgi:SPP1 family predicted phage head-tail adaptor
MRGGGFHNVATFEQPVEARDAGNVPVISWKKSGQAFTEVKTRNARTFREGNQFYERQVTEFWCRFFDVMQVKPDWRVKYDGQVYRITGIYPDHERKNSTRIETEFFNETSRS